MNEYEPRYVAGNSRVNVQISVEGMQVINPLLISFLSVTRFRRTYTPCRISSERQKKVTLRLPLSLLLSEIKGVWTDSISHQNWLRSINESSTGKEHKRDTKQAWCKSEGRLFFMIIFPGSKRYLDRRVNV